MTNCKIAQELIAVAKELVSAPVAEEKKITRATVKSVLKKMGLKPDQYELDASDVTFWPESFSDDWHKGDRLAKKAAMAFSKALGGLSIKTNQSKYWVRWRGEFIDMGEWGDPSSRWHY
jgi:hypothetical protein